MLHPKTYYPAYKIGISSKCAGLMNQAPTKRHNRSYASFASLTPLLIIASSAEMRALTPKGDEITLKFTL